MLRSMPNDIGASRGAKSCTSSCGHAMAILAAAGISLASAAQAADQSPRVATLYSAFKDGRKAFYSEYDKHLATFGWRARKFENTQLSTLAAALPEIDLLIGCSVYNYENAQDFVSVKKPFLEWLDAGGVALFTDASYGSSLAKGVCQWGQRFALTHALASAHTKPSAETRVVRASEGCALAAVPNALAPLATEHGHWAHFATAAPEWEQVLVDSDDRPILVCQQVGRGLLAVTNLSCMNRASAEKLGPALIENLWTQACARRAGVELRDVSIGPARTGRHSCAVGCSNLANRERKIRLVVTITSSDGEATEATSAGVLEPRAALGLAANYAIEMRGRHELTLALFVDGSEEPFYGSRKMLNVPPWISLNMTDRWLYPDYGEAAVSVTLSPDPKTNLNEAEMAARIVADNKVLVERTWPRPQLAQKVALPIAALPRGKATIEVVVRSGDKEQARAALDVHLCAQPKVWIKRDRQCIVDGKPFFPLGMYFVCWYLTQEQITDGLRDLAKRGFNTAHVGSTGKWDFGVIADEAHRLGMKLIVEFGTPREETVRKWKHHPAVLAWNPGDEPDGRGVPPSTMQARREAFKALDPDHPSYLTLCVPKLYPKYARFTDVLSIDPYPVRGASPDLLRVAQSIDLAQAAMGRERPIWVVPQAFGYEQKPNSWRVPTPAQERCMTYQALVHGARGLVYYTYLDGTFDLPKAPALREELTRLAREVNVLAPALMEPGDGHLLRLGRDGCVHVLVKRHGGRDWILAVNTSAQAAPQISIPVRAGAAEVGVLFEGRRLPVHGAAITDDFPAHGTHTYLRPGTKTTQ